MLSRHKPDLGVFVFIAFDPTSHDPLRGHIQTAEDYEAALSEAKRHLNPGRDYRAFELDYGRGRPVDISVTYREESK